ncbi:hypothetical protein Zmor_024595 [Zophobas morio]|uniref:Uncharacterized protein n=1 Tax=Zophobas morio TaxID=2755281 RepID=A0AA38M8V3_9CUCU|nr:hypothetical protein Zmor_024595 [Zophobas morio]
MEMTISRLFHLLQSKYAENEDVPQDKPELCVQAAANFRFRRKARLRATTLREFVKVNKNLRARRVFSFFAVGIKKIRTADVVNGGPKKSGQWRRTDFAKTAEAGKTIQI